MLVAAADLPEEKGAVAAAGGQYVLIGRQEAHGVDGEDVGLCCGRGGGFGVALEGGVDAPI